MPPTRQPAKASISEEGRRRRQATACTTCRSRRVKCDRQRPICQQCQKGDRSCEYISTPARGIEFVAEPQSFEADTNAQPLQSSETWKSVMGQQIKLVNRTKLEGSLPGDLPFWKLAEDSDSGAHTDSPMRLTECSGERPDNGFKPIFSHPSMDIGGIGHLGETFINSLSRKLPPPDICTVFFEDYVKNIHPIIPICHIPSLREIYGDFWLNLSNQTSVELLTLIISILYTGGASSEHPEQIERVSLLLELYEDLMRAFDISAYYFTQSAPSFRLLQGYVIMNTFRASKFAPFAAFGFLPFAIRSAQSLKLHTKSQVQDPIELEARIRLWWHLVYLDIESTIATGLQAVIRPNSYDVPLPYINPAQNTLLGTTSPMAVAMQGHWEWAHRMHVWYEKMPEQHEIVHFSRIIEHLHSLVRNSEEDEWTRIYLGLQVDRAYCMLGLRFWQLDQFKGTSCHSEVVKTARSFLSNFLHLSSLTRAANLTWFVPGIIQPIHALMILLLHLSTCEQREEEEIRNRDLVNQIFGLRRNRILSGVILPLGAHMRDIRARPHSNSRYSALLMLRTRVWQKFGWPIPDIYVPFGMERFLETQRTNVRMPSRSHVENDPEYDLGADDLSVIDSWNDFSAGPPLNTEDVDWEQWLSQSANLAADTPM